MTSTLSNDIPTVRRRAPIQRSLRASLRAAAIHATLSIVVAASLVVLLRLAWYPGAIFSAAGVMDFLVILLGVDIVLGPLFTAVVWAPGKASLRRDMFVIVALQVAGLGYGLHVLADTRPVFVVATQDRLRMVTRTEITDADAQTQQAGWTAQLRAAKLPEDAQERDRLIEEFMATGLDIDRKPAYWQGYANNADLLWSKAKPVSGLRLSEDDASRLRWAEWRQGVDLSQSRFVPMRVMRADISAVLHPTTHEPVAYLAQDPWVGLATTGEQAN